MTVTLKTEGDVSIIHMDDGKVNVFSPEMIQNFEKIMDQIPTDKGSVLITGRPGMFSAGFDLKVIQSGDMEKIKEMTIAGFSLLSRIFAFPRPVVAACSGHGIALGTFLLCCCDYRIGVKGDYLIGANEMKTNMVIPTPILELIKFRVSDQHKYRSILAAQMYSHVDAIEAHLLDEVVDENLIMERAIEKAQEVQEAGHPAYKLTKEIFVEEASRKINESIENIKKEN